MSAPDFNVHNSHATLSDFAPITNNDVQQLLSRMNKIACTSKLDLDCQILKNFSPISNLPFLSKLIEKGNC